METKDQKIALTPDEVDALYAIVESSADEVDDGLFFKVKNAKERVARQREIEADPVRAACEQAVIAFGNTDGQEGMFNTAYFRREFGNLIGAPSFALGDKAAPAVLRSRTDVRPAGRDHWVLLPGQGLELQWRAKHYLKGIRQLRVSEYPSAEAELNAIKNAR